MGFKRFELDLRGSADLLGSRLRVPEGQVLLRQDKEVFDDLVAMLRGDGFRMELDAPEGKLLVMNAHDEAVIGHCVHFEAIWNLANDQGMVARRIEGRGNALEHVLPVVADLA